jgi:FADH2 O2-dependent halogenase
MNMAYDIAVIGSGYAGSMMAMVASQLGYSVALLERKTHPRVVIGESSTPLANLLLEELAETYNLPVLKSLSKWGSWQTTHPEIACGLKRGFSFFHHDLQRVDNDPLSAENRLLVAASPHDDIADTHWFRADFDKFFVEQAKLIGVNYIDQYAIETCSRQSKTWTLSGEKQSSPLSIEAGFLIDATGPHGLIHRKFKLSEVALPGYPITSSLYCHFQGVQPLDILFGDCFTAAPFPVDDAAVHHIFDGGWVWVLRFNNGWTSAGIVATEEISLRFNLSEGEVAWHRLLEAFPHLKQQFANAVPYTSFTYIPKLSFQSETVIGEGWALLPSTSGFVDPLLSTGFPLTLLGIQRIGKALGLSHGVSSLSDYLVSYADRTRNEFAATARLIGSLYRSMADFPLFRAISMLYFVAASYSETARRLGRSELADGFLLSADASFASEYKRILDCADLPLSHAEKAAVISDIYRLVERFDVAGLSKRPVDNNYPVMAEDLFSAAYKFGASHSEIERLLERSGFSKALR